MKSWAKPCGYIRESQEDADQSPEAQKAGQRAAIEALAKRDGYDGYLTIYDDWDRSADERKIAKRTGYAAMLAAVRAGEVSAIYARSMDRLYRSMKTYLDLQAVCGEYGVRIVTHREGIIGGDGSPMATAFAQIGATFAEMELNTAKVRAKYGKATLRRKVAAGEVNAKTGLPYREGRAPYGTLPGESWEAVVAAFEATGAFLATARKLNADGLPTREGKPWETGVVARIVRAHRTDVPRGRQPGIRARSTRVFSGLLRCVCQTTLTTGMSSWKSTDGVRHPGVVRYLCRSGYLNVAHGRYQVNEKRILAWAKATLDATWRGPNLALNRPDPSEIAARLAAIEAKRRRVTDNYEDGEIDKATRDAKLLTLRKERDRLDTGSGIATIATFGIKRFDFDREPGLVNADLRKIWQYVQLGPDLQPVRALWVPAYEADGTLLWDELGPVPF